MISSEMCGKGVGIGIESDYPRSHVVHVVNPKGPEAGSYRVIRGSGWYRYYAQGVRSANRWQLGAL